MIPVDQRLKITIVIVDNFPVGIAAIVLPDLNRRIKMRHRDERFHVPFAAFTDHAVVISQRFRVRFTVADMREDAGNRDREAEYLKSHLRHQCDILGIGVIEIDAPALRIVHQISSSAFGNLLVGDPGLAEILPLVRVDALDDIRKRQRPAVSVIRSFSLAGADRPAPKKIMTEIFIHDSSPPHWSQ